MKSFIKLVVLGLFLLSILCEPLPGGENVCNQTLALRKDKTVDEPIKYEMKYQDMCGLLPCTKTRTETLISKKLVSTIEEVNQLTCCPGYAETLDRKCVPICLKSCLNGRCVRPEVCKCNVVPTETSPGYVGPTCSRYVCSSPNRWGKNCELECSCNENSYCSATTGKCICRDGWRGVNCTEECTPSMNCDSLELPPVIDPEVNVIDDTIPMGRAQNLVLSRDDDVSESRNRSVASIVATHMGLNLFLLVSALLLLMALYRNKKRLSQMRNELYYTYAPSSTGSGSRSSEYSTGTGRSLPQPIQNRPRLPTPHEQDFLSKNLSFATTTRNILKGNVGQPDKNPDCRDKFLLDPKTENHLIKSQIDSEQNIYSDLESNFSSERYNVSVDNERRDNRNSLYQIPEERTTNINTSREDEHEYQVPKSSSATVDLSLTNTTFDQDRSRTLTTDLSAFDDTDSSNIYEEIKPKLPPPNKK